MHEPMAGPNPLMIAPFGLLLACIALAPLFFNKWWLRHYPKVALGLGAVTLIYYLGFLHAHERALHTGIEYVSFIALIGSLFVVSGGIHINVKGEATPVSNVVFLAIGTLVANVLGTTGASMLLIRPWIRMNKYRITSHHVVFFIFVVSNVGGCLTPIGDPPLFLGYLKGIPFWWVASRCWPMWLVGVSLLLLLFYLVDRRNYRRAPRHVREEMAEAPDVWRFQGLHNLFFLAVILGAVFLNNPPFLREILMVGAAIGSFYTTPRPVHESNDFNFHPIQEVAVLFAGIFATMMPALDWLQIHASSLGDSTPTLFFWGTGLLSSVLDNAPTYLSFLSTALGAFSHPEQVQSVLEHLATHGFEVSMLAGAGSETLRHAVLAVAGLAGVGDAGAVTPDQVGLALLLADPGSTRALVAISVGAVFFGACTYIGNGPNFMVKSIAEHQKVHVPSFLSYVARFTLPYLLPVLVIVWLIFFR